MADEGPMGNDSADQLMVEEIITNPDSNSDIVQSKEQPKDTGFTPLQDYMGISSPDEGQKDKLQYIWEHFAKGRDRAETLQAIKETKDTLAAPEIGENYLHKLYAFTRLLADERVIQKEKKVYTNDAGNHPVDRTQ